jgi:hypothetical protein
MVLGALANAFDETQAKLAALMAVLGAMSERYPAHQDRIEAWCDLIVRHSDPKDGVKKGEILRHIRDFLRGEDDPTATRN